MPGVLSLSKREPSKRFRVTLANGNVVLVATHAEAWALATHTPYPVTVVALDGGRPV